MTLTKAFTTVVITGLVGAAVGAGLGYLIGRYAPDAYRGFFAWGNSADFSPIEFGVGLGVVQGLVGGLVIGVIVVAIVAWANTRPGSQTESRKTD